MLCYYYGDQTFLVDSTQVDTLNGAMRFTQNKRLPEGVYFIAKPEGVVMDFIVAGWKDFSISTTSNSLYDSAKVENSRENEVFFDYMRAIQHTAAQSAQMREMNQMLRKATKDRKVLEENERKFVELYQNLEKTLKNTIQDNPSLYITKLLLANQQPDVPDNISLDSECAWRRSHAMLIRTMKEEEIDEFLGRASLGRIACESEGQPYIADAYFAAERGFLYSFSAVGQKIRWMRANPSVCTSVRSSVCRIRGSSLPNRTELPWPIYSTQSAVPSPLLATYWALASIISFGISTPAGHSRRH